MKHFPFFPSMRLNTIPLPPATRLLFGVFFSRPKVTTNVVIPLLLRGEYPTKCLQYDNKTEPTEHIITSQRKYAGERKVLLEELCSEGLTGLQVFFTFA